MADNRPRVTPTKPVNLEQLDAELGGGGLSRNDESGEIVATDTVTQKQLDDAVAAHTAEFPPDRDEQLADIRAKAEALPQNNPARPILLGLIDTV